MAIASEQIFGCCNYAVLQRSVQQSVFDALSLAVPIPNHGLLGTGLGSPGYEKGATPPRKERWRWRGGVVR
jgi:hypothetical protein